MYTVYSIKAYEFRSKLSNLEDDFGCLFFYIDINSMGGGKLKVFTM